MLRRGPDVPQRDAPVGREEREAPRGARDGERLVGGAVVEFSRGGGSGNFRRRGFDASRRQRRGRRHRDASPPRARLYHRRAGRVRAGHESGGGRDQNARGGRGEAGVRRNRKLSAAAAAAARPAQIQTRRRDRQVLHAGFRQRPVVVPRARVRGHGVRDGGAGGVHRDEPDRGAEFNLGSRAPRQPGHRLDVTPGAPRRLRGRGVVRAEAPRGDRPRGLPRGDHRSRVRAFVRIDLNRVGDGDAGHGVPIRRRQLRTGLEGNCAGRSPSPSSIGVRGGEEGFARGFERSNGSVRAADDEREPPAR